MRAIPSSKVIGQRDKILARPRRKNSLGRGGEKEGELKGRGSSLDTRGQR